MPHSAPRTQETTTRSAASRKKAGSAGNGSSKASRNGKADVASEHARFLREEISQLPQVQKLLAAGEKQGFLTFEEVGEVFPGAGSEEWAKELHNLVVERGIRVAPSRKPPSSARRGGKGMEEAGATNDPVRVYLREMGQVSLLTREGEVAIAKRIEAGEHDQERAVLGTPFGIREVLRIADELKKNKVELKTVVDGLDDVEPVHTPEERRKIFFQKVTKVRRLETEVSKKAASIANSRTSWSTTARR